MIVISYTGCTGKTMVAELFARDKNLQSQLKQTLNYAEYSADVIQDILLQILTTNNDTNLIKACQRDQFNFWLFSIVKTQRNSPTSHTNRLYNQKTFELNDNQLNTEKNEFETRQDEQHRKFLADLIKKELIRLRQGSKANRYSFEIFTQFVHKKEEYRLQGKKLTTREFAQLMNIKKSSIWMVIDKVKQKLKQKLDGNL